MAHSKDEILALLNEVPVAAIATSAGEKLRQRMMHYAADEDLNIYLATMKGDPKTFQLTNFPSISLLCHQATADINESREVEMTGKALFVRDQKERQKALELTARRSPVVKYLTETGNAGVLDCIKVVPDTIKYRVFKEIVQGQSPTVIEFPQNRQVVSEWPLLKTKLKNWALAARLPFLTASVVPVLLGSVIAWFTAGVFSWWFLFMTLVAGVTIHIGTNIMNDYMDYRSGNDEVNREFVRPFSGGSRAIQLGLLTPAEVLGGAIFFFVISSLIGFYLAWATGPLILILGAIGLVSGIFYTGGFFNWAKRGIGELLVGLNFGVLMTLGAFYVQARSVDWLPVVAAIPVSLLIAAVLYINEFPDYTADRRVGKNTLVVRLGRRRAVVLYAAMMAAVYVFIAATGATGFLPRSTLVGLATLPLAIRATLHARKHFESSFDLAPANALTVTTHLATGLLLTVAFTWEVLGTGGAAYVALLAAASIGLVVWLYRQVEKQKNIFIGLKQAVR